MPLDDEPQQHERALLWAAAWRRRHQYDAEMEPWERMSPDLMRVSWEEEPDAVRQEFQP